jgi:hypothetical protein
MRNSITTATTTRPSLDLGLVSVMLIVAAALGACGEKPKAKPEILAPAPVEPTPEPSTPVESRTRGGVDLAAALESAGDVRQAVLDGALLLHKDRASGVAMLTAAKSAARATVVALFESKNIDEVIGALSVASSDGDPVELGKDRIGLVMGQLDHEVAAVRDVAWDAAPKVADGAALATMLPSASAERKLGLVRLLAQWDGAPVQDALWSLVEGEDATLALEAALAMSSVGKTLGATGTERVAKLLAGSEAKSRLGLLLQRRAGDGKPAGLKEAIDRALVSKDEALVIEGVRATTAFPADEREPLYEQLAQDPRLAVRSVTAEVLGVHGRGLALDKQGPTIALVTKLLADIEGDVRMAAARARSMVGTVAERKAALEALLAEGHRGVRMAAAVSMAEPDLIEACAEALAKQVVKEEREGRATILGALASSKNRSALLAVTALLDSSDNATIVAAHFALTSATKQDFATKRAAWEAWLDKTYPPPAPKGE